MREENREKWLKGVWRVEREGSGGRRGKCRIRCDIVNATVN